jgi:penicillin-binding protein 1B
MSRKKSRPRKSRKLLKFAIFSTIILGIVTFFAYVYIDKQVLTALSTRTSSPLSAVYAAPTRITHFDHLPKKTLLHFLTQRNYRETIVMPKLPGEYYLSENNIIIYTRSFSWSNQRKADGGIIKVSFDGDNLSEITDNSNQEKILNLEPAILASLSDSEYRASNYKKLSEIPAQVKNAVMAVEDERFYKHFGVDPEALLRAVFANLRSLEFAQGGSTLTQQLAKNILFSPEKTFGRKFMEILAAFSLEKRLTKDQILEMYLNEIYLGQEGSFAIHGVAEACQAFLGKRIEEISVAEAALLAGIIRAPSSYSPRKHLDRALRRKDLALDKMRELNFITESEMNAAKAQKIQIVQQMLNKRSAPFFITALEKDLSEHFNIEAASQSGINIYTGINDQMQNCAETLLTSGIEAIEKKYPRIKRKDSPLEGALVAIEPQSGLIKAWAGGRDYTENQFNHVNQAIRQIGSTIKPFLYLTALDSTLNTYKTATTTSVLSDEPVQIDQVNQKTWEPENYDRTFRGDVTLRYALENSLNLPAVYVAQRVGIDNFAATVKKFRLTDQLLAVPALALGAADTTLLRLTGAYSALANGGIYVSPRLFINTEARDGTVLAKSAIEEEVVAQEDAVFILTDILKGVVLRGTAAVVRSMGFTAPAAGKTGTSNDTRDGWFVGFTPNLAVGVWVGFDDNKKIGLTGGVLAAPIWTKFMQCIQDYNPPIDFIPTKNVITVDIDSTSLERAGPGCPPAAVVKEIYIRGTEPRKICPRHNNVEGDSDYNENSDEDRGGRPENPRKRKKGFWENLFG